MIPISVTPSGKACLHHVDAGLIAYAERMMFCTSAPCSAPTSSLVTPRWVTPTHIIAAMGGVS
jgi:hypothetical protein